ncbi:unnamed protein product [Camellia sinensis]
MNISLSTWLFLFITLSINLDLVPSQCLDHELLTLLKLKQGLTFDAYLSSSKLKSKLTSWNSSTDCCSWAGVTCNDSHVTGLDLSSKSISGGIGNTSNLFDLQYLQSLNLANNSFNAAQIPSGLGKLVRLVHLNFSNSGFVGQIPLEISSLTRLITLDLSALYFLGSPRLKLEKPSLRILVRNLTKLTELYLDGTEISAQGDDWCQTISLSLPNLRVLSLSNCDLSGPLHPSLQTLRSLSVIQLSDNNLSGPIPEFIANFSNLTSLHLRNCQLFGTLPEKIIKVPTLQSLDLSDNGLLEGPLPEFPQKTSFQTLLLGYTNFSGKLPNSIGNLEGLSILILGSCNFTGPIPNSLVLGVERNASQYQIQKAFDKLSLQYQPNKNKNKGAQEKFAKINNAYDILSDEEKRKNYDLYGVEKGNPGFDAGNAGDQGGYTYFTSGPRQNGFNFRPNEWQNMGGVRDVSDPAARKLGVDALPAVVGWLSNGEKHTLKTRISVKDVKSAVEDLSALLDGFEKRNKKTASSQAKKPHSEAGDKQIPLLTPFNFDALCGDTAPVCIIGAFRSSKARGKLETILSSEKHFDEILVTIGGGLKMLDPVGRAFCCSVLASISELIIS